MHKLMEYICDELEELERKAEKDGKLSMAEVQYADVLLHMKKNLLKAEEMYEESEYSEARGGRGGSSRRNSYDGMRRSYEGGSYEGNGGGGSYARGGENQRRDSRGRYSSRYGRDYSRSADEMVEQVRELMQEAPDDRTRQEFQRFVEKLERM